ncbi:MAG: deoxynucleoside kinase [Sphingomonadaceae bacterium]
MFVVDQTRIEVCGAIASGKTTLATRLSARLDGFAVFEKFRENPFWSRFYAQPELFRPEKDVCFLAHHTGEIKAAGNGLVVCDYAPVQDLAYARLADDSAHVAMMEAVYRHLYGPLRRAALVVHLKCATGELLRRIHVRGRAEEFAIDAAYLVLLEQALAALLAYADVPVMIVHSDTIDFATEGAEADNLLNSIAERLSAVAP